MTDQEPGAELTDAEKLAAIGTYTKVLGDMEKKLRAAVTDDMGKKHVERVGAYLPDGTRMATVSRSDGAKKAKVADEAALIAWAADRHPEEVETVTVQVVRPAFVKLLLDTAKATGTGVDPRTGEALPFIEVATGNPYVTVTTTDEGIARMEALAHGFAGMLEGLK